ncbi:MAG: hypothetical protein O8C63_09585 [Candidatus Methanoperedens sp.]|nr:hypothetical protein [Candidatus Methanoperedens sp.]
MLAHGILIDGLPQKSICSGPQSGTSAVAIPTKSLLTFVRKKGRPILHIVDPYATRRTVCGQDINTLRDRQISTGKLCGSCQRMLSHAEELLERFNRTGKDGAK